MDPSARIGWIAIAWVVIVWIRFILPPIGLITVDTFNYVPAAVLCGADLHRGELVHRAHRILEEHCDDTAALLHGLLG